MCAGVRAVRLPGVTAGSPSSWPAGRDGFWSWQGQAACRSVGSTLFYPPDGERGSRKRRRERAAKAICATCPVVGASDWAAWVNAMPGPNARPTLIVTGKVTVPTLWDKKTGRIVNNESSEIIRMFNSAFRAHTSVSYDFYPEEVRGEIDRINEVVYRDFNNGVYRAGFARSQEAYEEAAKKVFQCLDMMENLLAERRYLAGDRITEADWRAFPTLLRFDLVYYSHFKCNLRRIQDYPNLANYLRELYQWPGIKDTLDRQKIKAGYYGQLNVNPTGIFPIGPNLDHLESRHDRNRLRAAA